ncbi:MAG: hypothetical protein RIQ74_1141 [Pseudomonadota bacterium]|jgi:hypothetical protein
MYKNMKIAITDEVQLKAVCDVLESMGFKLGFESEIKTTKHIKAYSDGVYDVYCFNVSGCNTTLTDLLTLRDKQFKEQLNAAD